MTTESTQCATPAEAVALLEKLYSEQIAIKIGRAHV